MSKEFNALVKKMGYGNLFPQIIHLILLDVNGFFELNENLMALLTGSKLAWLKKDFINVLFSVLY